MDNLLQKAQNIYIKNDCPEKAFDVEKQLYSLK